MLYGRGFVTGTRKAFAGLALAGLSDEQRLDHDAILELRHKHVAHADISMPGEVPVLALVLPPEGAPDIPIEAKLWIKYLAATRGDELARHLRVADALAAEFKRLGEETLERIQARGSQIALDELRAKVGGQGVARMDD